jgi:hypothetical protein
LQKVEIDKKRGEGALIERLLGGRNWAVVGREGGEVSRFTLPRFSIASPRHLRSDRKQAEVQPDRTHIPYCAWSPTSIITNPSRVIRDILALSWKTLGG